MPKKTAPKETLPRPINITQGRFDFPVKPNPFRVSEPFGEAPRFVFHNQTRLYAKVTFKDDLFLDAKGQPLKKGPVIEPGEKSDPLMVNTTLRVGTYSYRVKLYDKERSVTIEGSGRSRPEVEIQK